MNTLTRRIKKVENTLKAVEDKIFNTVVIVEQNDSTGIYKANIAGQKHQGTKVEIDEILEPYIKGGSAIIIDDITELREKLVGE